MRYHDTGECPRCGSLRTGRFIEKITKNETQTQLKYLKKGELIRFRNEYTPKEYNCFCDDCESNWYEKIEVYSIDNEELQEILEEKEISGKESQEIDKINKNFRKERRKKKIKNVIKWVLPLKR